jgi:hypothetical protein
MDERVIAPAKGECKTSNILEVIKAVKEKEQTSRNQSPRE